MVLNKLHLAALVLAFFSSQSNILHAEGKSEEPESHVLKFSIEQARSQHHGWRVRGHGGAAFPYYDFDGTDALSFSTLEKHWKVPFVRSTTFAFSIFLPNEKRRKGMAVWTKDTGGYNYVRMVVTASGKIKYSCVGSGFGYDWVSLESNLSVADGKWHSVALVSDKEAKATRIYIDGKLDAQVARFPRKTGCVATAPVNFGWDKWRGIAPLKGGIANVTAFDRSLNDTEVSLLHKGFSEGVKLNLVKWKPIFSMPCDEQGGQAFHDSVSQSIAGSISGARRGPERVYRTMSTGLLDFKGPRLVSSLRWVSQWPAGVNAEIKLGKTREQMERNGWIPAVEAPDPVWNQVGRYARIRLLLDDHVSDEIPSVSLISRAVSSDQPWRYSDAGPALHILEKAVKVKNAKFKKDDNKDGIPDGWEVHAHACSSQEMLDSVDGRRCVKVSRVSAVPDWSFLVRGYTQKDILVNNAATHLRGEFWLKTEKIGSVADLTDGARVGVSVTYQDGTKAGPFRVLAWGVRGDNGWHPVTFRHPFSKPVKSVDLHLGINRASIGSAAWFSDVKLWTETISGKASPHWVYDSFENRFPVGTYLKAEYTTPRVVASLADRGYNFAVAHRDDRLLEAASRSGLKIIEDFPGEGTPIRSEDFALRSASWGSYIFDEPQEHGIIPSIKVVEKRYETVKSINSKIPTLITTNESEWSPNYEADVLSFDFYVSPKDFVSAFRRATQVNAGTRPVWVTPGTFGKDDARWPRCITYSALAEGACGILFFRLGCEHDKEERKLAGELSFLSNILIFGHTQPWAETANDSHILSRAWKFDSNLDGKAETFLITVNTSNTPRLWKRRMPKKLQGYMGHLLFANQKVTRYCDKYEMRVELKPFEAKIWRLLPEGDADYNKR